MRTDQPAFPELAVPDRHVEPSPGAQERPTKRGHVRETSIAQYQVGRERLRGRAANVLRQLAAYVNRRQVAPTSAELTKGDSDGYSTDALLYVRRGLSDLQRLGLVQAVPNGSRICRVSQRKCETWRVIPVGR